MTDKPGGAAARVSVLAACYNHSAYVAQALDSAAAQTFDDFELVIVDDASKDGAQDVIRRWLDEHPEVRASFIAQETNRGACATLNRGLSLCRGEFVAPLPCDDVWRPDRLRIQVDMLDSSPPRVGAVYSDAALIDGTGQQLPGRFISSYAHFDEPPQGDLYELLLRGNFIPGMTTLIRRLALESVGPFDESLVFEDWDWWLRFARRYEFAFSSYVAADYRILSTSLVRTMGERADDAYWHIYRTNVRHAGHAREHVRDELARLYGVLSERHPGRRRQLAWQRLRAAPGRSALREFVRASASKPGRS
jgi:glycosyltransferase involved in cell wall biosynthesis